MKKRANLKVVRIGGRIADTPEHLLQVRLLDILTYAMRPDLRVIAIPNQGKRSLRTGKRMKAEGMMAGVADLLIMFPAAEGSVGWLEMKTRTGSLSDRQHGFAAICARLGHRWAMARSVDEAIDVLRDWNALKHGVNIR